MKNIRFSPRKKSFYIGSFLLLLSIALFAYSDEFLFSYITHQTSEFGAALLVTVIAFGALSIFRRTILQIVVGFLAIIPLSFFLPSPSQGGSFDFHPLLLLTFFVPTYIMLVILDHLSNTNPKFTTAVFYIGIVSFLFVVFIKEIVF